MPSKILYANFCCWSASTTAYLQVYSASQESRYLLVQGVPALGAHQELVKQFALYGTIQEYNILDQYPAEEFTEVFLFKFLNIQSARYRALVSFFILGRDIWHIFSIAAFHPISTMLKVPSHLKKIGGIFLNWVEGGVGVFSPILQIARARNVQFKYTPYLYN